MLRIEIDGEPLRPGDEVHGRIALDETLDPEDVELRLRVSRRIVRPLSSTPSSRWIALERRLELGRTRAADRSIPFAFELPRLDELKDAPVERPPALVRFLARLLRVRVEPLEWELAAQATSERGSRGEALRQIAVVEPEQRDAA